MNNLPKVVTQQRHGRASNPRLLDRKSDALPLSHRATLFKLETRCRIPIWRTFWRIQWHVILEPRITLRGAALLLPLGEFTVTIPEPHATLQGVRIPSAILKIVFRHILFFFVFNAV